MAQRTKFGDLSFDATLVATHVLTSEITDHPVEDGADPSDHIRPKSQTVSLDVVFSPLALSESDPEGRGEAPGDDSGRGWANDGYKRLIELQGQALTLQMPWRTMTNMAISSISNPVSAGSDGFRVKVDFKQIRFVSSSTIRFERKVPTKIKTKPTNNPDQGKKAPTPEPLSAKRSSTLKSGLNAWGVTTEGGGVFQSNTGGLFGE